MIAIRESMELVVHRSTSQRSLWSASRSSPEVRFAIRVNREKGATISRHLSPPR